MVDGPATGPETDGSREVGAAGTLELYLTRAARGARSSVAGAKAGHRVMDRMSRTDQHLESRWNLL